jgi:hypothetical protein
MLMMAVVMVLSGCGSTAGGVGSMPTTQASDESAIEVTVQGLVQIPQDLELVSNLVSVIVAEGDALLVSRSVEIVNGELNIAGLITHPGTFSVALRINDGDLLDYVWSVDSVVVTESGEVDLGLVAFEPARFAAFFVQFDDVNLTDFAVDVAFPGESAAYRYAMRNTVSVDGLVLAQLPVATHESVTFRFSARQAGQLIPYVPIVAHNVVVKNFILSAVSDDSMLPLHKVNDKYLLVRQ